MKKEYRARLQAQHEYLMENLEVEPIAHLLYQENVLTSVDHERIQAERSRPDKVVLFLKILDCKTDDRCYEQFRKSLAHAHVKQEFIGQILDDTVLPKEVQEDSRQKLLIEQILMDSFVLEEHTKCPKQELLRFLKNQLRRQKQSLVLCEDDITALVAKVFPQAELRKTRKGKVCTIIGVRIKADVNGLTAAESDEDRAICGVKDASEEQVALAVRKQLEKEGLDVALAEQLEDNEIDGRALELILDIENIQALFPEMKKGKLVKFLVCLKAAHQELKNQPQQARNDTERTAFEPKKLETFRAFDTQSKVADFYELGLVLPTEKSRPGNLLDPVHKYCACVSNMKQLATEVVQFAAACMNERCNGTIHFGVVGKVDSGDQQVGEIVGIIVDKKDCELAITDEIYGSFCPDQISLALSCIREPECVPVVVKGTAVVNGNGSKFVVEVDVIPHSEVVRDSAFFSKPLTKEGKARLYRYAQGAVMEVHDKELFDYMKEKKTLTQKRKEKEMEFSRQVFREDLHKKLHRLLTGGNDYQMADIYPVLFLSKRSPNMSREFLEENFRGIKSLDPLAVFDFDPLADQGDQQFPLGLYTVMEYQLGQVHKTLTTDSFNENSGENSLSGYGCDVTKLCDEILNSSLRTWIFCNGYGPLAKEELSPAAWIRKRALGFKDAVRFYEKQIPTENARILIFVLSKACDVLLPALEEVFAKFPDQWILVAESEQVLQDMTAEMLRRGYVEKDALEERSIVGMPWSHVNQSIMSIFGYRSGTGCMLTSSSGTEILLKERKKNEWSDLEILSTKQCSDEVEELMQKEGGDALSSKKTQTEEEYYRGAQVTWWNFYFKTHVLERDQAKELQEKVEEYLSGVKIPKDERVGVVNLLHQPGAGATTIARQVLWNLKSKYRCCVVKQITDQTCDHICNLRGFEEKHSAKPPVILVDNQDFEKFCRLRSQLNERARRQERGGKAVLNVFCVLIFVRRITRSFNKGRRPMQEKTSVMLDHELKPEDIQWFKDKYKTLEERYEEKRGLNPKLLFSFNILKENFNQNYMQRTVNEFIDEIHDYREKRFLKFVALINSFDLDFTSVPMSCFNPVMCPQQHVRRHFESKPFSRGDIHWASTLSQSLNVLLNRSSKPFCGKDIMAVRIVNNNLSKEILKNLCQRENEKVSDVVSQFLRSDIFKRSDVSTVQSQFGKLVKDVLKTRAVTRNGREKFSPIILNIIEKEGYQQAAGILELAFDIFDDQMLAQQIARVYIQMQKFEEAEKFARIAKSMDNLNSFLCDTLGQVYYQKLLVLWDNVVKSKDELEGEKTREIMDVAFTAIDIFRNEQTLSDQAFGFDYTNCGFIFELRVISTLVDICHFLRPFKNTTGLLHQFFVDQTCIPAGLIEQLGEENVHKLKRLYLDYEKPLKRLEDEEVQLKDDPSYQESTGYMRNAENCHMLSKVKVRLMAVFGENGDEVPKQLCEEEACEFRRRIVLRKGGSSLFAVRKLREEKDALKNFESMYKMMHDNVTSNFCVTEDLRALLNFTMGRMSLDKNCAQTLSFEDAMRWALRLYETKALQLNPTLEACLYLMTFHWPTEWRKEQKLPLCPCNLLRECMERWKQAFLDNHPAQKQKGKPDRRKPTTLFFLGQGTGFDEIVFYSEFEHLQSTDGGSIWNNEEVKGRLKQLTGTLHTGGKSILVKLHPPDGGTQIRLDLCTSFPITDKSMWNKTVNFVLGFSWAGPKAYDVNQDFMEATDNQDAVQHNAVTVKTHDSSSSRLSHQEMIAQEDQFWKQREECERQINALRAKRRANSAHKDVASELDKKIASLSKKLDDMIQRRKAVLQGSD